MKIISKLKTVPNKIKRIERQKVIIPVFVLLGVNLIISIALSVSSIGTQNITAPITNQQNLFLTTNGVNVTKNATQLLNDAITQLDKSKSVEVILNGEIKNLLTQKLSITKKYDGATYYTQTISTGIKNLANKVYYTPQSSDVVTIIHAKSVSKNNVVWQDNPVQMTYNGFVERFSVSPEMYIPYKITPVTISTISEVISENGIKKFNINLHPTLATKTYGKSMQRILKSHEAPVFENIMLDIVLDENNNFKTITAHEEYTITLFGVKTKCVATHHISLNIK